MATERFLVNETQKRAIAVALVIAIVGGAILLKPYFSLCVLAIILAFLFAPVYTKLLQRSGNSGRAAMLTFLVASLAIIIPMIAVIYFSVRQVNSLVTNADFAAINSAITSFIELFNDLLQRMDIHIDPAKVSQQIGSTIQALGQSLVSSIPGLFSGFLAFITSAIIFIYVFLSLLKNNDTILTLVRLINPLGEQISNLYFAKMSAMTKATVRGQFIIALCQGLESAIVLSIAGMGDLFFFFLMLLTALSVVPMGAGIVTIPLGIILVLTGQVWQGALIILNHLIIVTNIDNVLRPRLVPREARLDPALMILAVFSGVAYFGFMGIVLGPVLMIVIVTTIEVYLAVYRNINAQTTDTKHAKRPSLYQRFRNTGRRLLGTKPSPSTEETSETVAP